MSDLTRLDHHTSSIAVLTLDHHEHRNALSIAMRDELSDRLDLLGADPDVKVVIIANAGSVFCAGFDLREFERAATDPTFAEILWSSSDRYHRSVATLPIIAIAAVDGPAIAGGFDLAVLCDLRVASTATTFSHPEHVFGDVVYGPLCDLVGGALARELCLTGRTLSAAEARAAHLVSGVVGPGEVLAAAIELAEQVAVAPRDVLCRMKAKMLARAGVVDDSGVLRF